MDTNREKVYKSVLANTKEGLDINFKILTLFGMWCPQQCSSSFKRHIYSIYSILVVGSCFFLYLFTEVINFVFVFGDMEATVNATFMMLTHIAQAAKTVNTLLRRDRIQHLIDTLDEPVFNEVDPEVMPSIISSIHSIKITILVFLALCSSTVLLWAIFPFLESGEETRLPLNAWYPFDTTSSPRFEIVFAYQIISTLINALCNMSQDTIISGSMGLACIQLDILHGKLADRHRYTNPTSHTNRSSKDFETHKHLEHCIHHHLKIMNFVKEIELLFGGAVLFQFSATTVIICVTAFKLTTLPMSIELFSMVLYIACMLMEILLYCYHGNELIVKSQLINDAAYKSPWYEYSLSNQKFIFLIMERSKRPLQVSAGIFALSLATFTSILRSSYSYYAVLQRVSSEESD